MADKHTSLLIFRVCSQPSLYHLLSSDVYYNFDPTSPNPSLSSWSSPFITKISTFKGVVAFFDT